MNRPRRAFSLPLATLSVLFASVILFGSTVSAQSLTEARPLSHNEQIIFERSQQVEQKATVLESTSQEVQTLEQKKQALADQLEAEKAKIEELKQKIAEKKAAQARVVTASTQSYSLPANTGPIGNCGDNYYASFIYGMESGGKVVGNCNPTARNAGGCLGIGQACPGSKLLAVCPNLDYACENAFFNNYAISRYGSWAGAYEAWQRQGWW
jgi:hypothetical protein